VVGLVVLMLALGSVSYAAPLGAPAAKHAKTKHAKTPTAKQIMAPRSTPTWSHTAATASTTRCSTRNCPRCCSPSCDASTRVGRQQREINQLAAQLGQLRALMRHRH
jgi:hypothetical protein